MNQSVDQKTLLVILGMHRSGTSAISRAMGVFGASHGDNLLEPVAGINDKGFWEDADIVQLNADLMAEVGLDWHSLKPLVLSDLSVLRAKGYFDKAKNLLAEKMDGYPIFAFKDPRVSKCLLFWKEVFSESKINLVYILAVRNPFSVASSLHKRDGFSQSKSFYLWLDHVLSALSGSKGQNSIVVDYDNLVTLTDNELTRLAKKLNLKINRTDVVDYKTKFLDGELRHSQFLAEDLIADESIPTLLREVYSFMVDAAQDKIYLQSEKSHQKIATWMQEHQTNRFLYSMIDDLSINVNSLNAELRTATVKQNEVAALNNMIANKNNEITVLNDMITKKDNEINSILTSKSWRITAIFRLFANFFRELSLSGWRTAARSIIRRIYSRSAILVRVRHSIFNWKDFFYSKIRESTNSKNNLLALQALSSRRSNAYEPYRSLKADPINWPLLGISIVTHNSQQWLDSYLASLRNQAYPLNRIHLTFVDHESTDGTIKNIQALLPELEQYFSGITLIEQKNLGFGSGHDVAIRQSSAELCLVSNIDLEFTKDSLISIVKTALSDKNGAFASWEMRQIPFEHPKYYDPVTLETNWSSHACILIRKSAYLKVGGYEPKIFMYAEDVELSYRFRSFGYRLKYCPSAVVRHYPYSHAEEVKPLQYIGSTLGNSYLRLRYGKRRDRVLGIALNLVLLSKPQTFPGAHDAVYKNIIKIVSNWSYFFQGKGHAPEYYPFRAFDYDLKRDGAFHNILSNKSTEFVSVITRTYSGRDKFLRQCIMSVANQTYQNIELIIVEDGGNSMPLLVDEMRQLTALEIKYFPLEKVGRSAAGNYGMSEATGKYMMFLDDDDLLFSDHVEILINEMTCSKNCSAAYSLSFEVKTEPCDSVVGYLEKDFQQSTIYHQDFDYNVLLDHNYIPIQSLLFRRDLFLTYGGFDESLDQLEDWNLWLRYACENRFKYVPKTTSLFRVPASPDIRLSRHLQLHDSYNIAKERALQVQVQV
ncbi:MAG: glycosyltransferase [Gammaproteobacteria bacterium]|nr:glycosyltransferase [Gammaproteobacteria bacterium]